MVVVGSFSAGGAAIGLTAGSVEDTFTSVETALAASLSDALPSVVFADRLAGNVAARRCVIEQRPPIASPVAAFVPANASVAALIFPGPKRVRLYLAAEISGEGERWVDMPMMREFYALPQAERTSQKRAWIDKLRVIDAADWPEGIDQSSVGLGRLSAPSLRVLVAALSDRALPVSGVNQPAKEFRGGQVRGATLPLFAYPVVEPSCYLRVIAGREGVLESINAYDLGAGVSIGPIQFNAHRGALLKFLRALEITDPALFRECFSDHGWTTAEEVVDGETVPKLEIGKGTSSEIILRGVDSARRRVVGYFQSGDPADAGFPGINAAWRKRIAGRLRDAIAWPHVQEMVQDISAGWLQPGLDLIHRAGIQPVDPSRPAREHFILKALLLSAYVRYSSSLAPLLRALEPFHSPQTKLAAIQQVLLSNTAWPELSIPKRKALAERLAAQENDADAVWETIRALADQSALLAAPFMPGALSAPPADFAAAEEEGHDHVEDLALLAAPMLAEAAQDGAIVRDATVAVPEFTAAERRTIVTPLLSASASAGAITWTRAQHPQQSGLDVGQIAAALRLYVDFPAVGAALSIAGPWNGTIDAIFVEAVHQFQVKCFRAQGDHDGRAGETTLDALGYYFGRPGLNSVDIANPTAQAHLDKNAIKNGVAAAADNPGGGLAITSRNWFRHMVQTSFLGHKFTNGIHAGLVRRLRAAERHLLTLPAYRGMTPARLGAALGIRETHKGFRPSATTGSMHTFGLATDINYFGNPWVEGADFPRVLRRARLFISSQVLANGSAAQLLHRLAGTATAPIFDELERWNADFKAYLARANDLRGILSLVQGHIAAGTAGVVQPGETANQAAERWQQTIRTDLSSLATGDGFSNGRDPRDGFLDLHRDLVLALRDRGCLAWGAVDFGPNASGDIMHFDCRNTGIGRVVNRGFAPPERNCP